MHGATIRLKLQFKLLQFKLHTSAQLQVTSSFVSARPTKHYYVIFQVKLPASQPASQPTVRWYMNGFPGFTFNFKHIPLTYLASSLMLMLLDRVPSPADAADKYAQ